MITSTPQIHTWFPKPIFIVDGVLQDKIDFLESKVREVIKNTGTQGNDFLSVGSTHKVSPDLHKNPDFKDLADVILEHAKGFASRLGHGSNRVDRLEIGTMWTNISYQGDFIFPHIHPDSFLSGVYYIKKFPGSKITFFDNYNMLPTSDEFNDLSYEYCHYDCEPGRLLLWKSDFLHGNGRQTEGEKIAISFNIQVRTR